MPAHKPKDLFAEQRVLIGQRTRVLRQSRRWTQAELANRLHISQNQLSRVEHGTSSFTAEQFLKLLRVFNASVAYFVDDKGDSQQQLQNALVRLGARHLYESSEVLPSEQLERAQVAIKETVIDGSPRLITGLGPVLVRNVDDLNLTKLVDELSRVGLARRFAWVVENTLLAVERLAQLKTPNWVKLERRIQLPFNQLLAAASHASKNSLLSETPDVLDKTVRTQKTFNTVELESSDVSRHWGIVTSLQVEDFVEALRAAEIDV